MSPPRPIHNARLQSRISISILGEPAAINPVKAQLGRLKKLTGRSMQHLVLEALKDFVTKHQALLQQTESTSS
jgi:hypothetical protein